MSSTTVVAQQRLVTKVGYKKPELLLREAEKRLRQLGLRGKELRRALAELIKRGKVELPKLVVKEVVVEREALRKALETVLKETTGEEREILEKMLRELENIPERVKSEEELRKYLQQIFEQLSQETVIDVAKLESSLRSYLLQKGLSEKEVAEIINEIYLKVFGKPGIRWYIVKSPEELKQIIEKIQNILKEHNVPYYEVVTRYIPVVEKVQLVKVEELAEKLKSYGISVEELKKLFGEKEYVPIQEAEEKVYELVKKKMQEYNEALSKLSEHSKEIRMLLTEYFQGKISKEELEKILSKIVEEKRKKLLAEAFKKGDFSKIRPFERLIKGMVDAYKEILRKRYGIQDENLLEECSRVFETVLSTMLHELFSKYNINDLLNVKVFSAAGMLQRVLPELLKKAIEKLGFKPERAESWNPYCDWWYFGGFYFKVGLSYRVSFKTPGGVEIVCSGSPSVVIPRDSSKGLVAILALLGSIAEEITRRYVEYIYGKRIGSVSGEELLKRGIEKVVKARYTTLGDIPQRELLYKTSDVAIEFPETKLIKSLDIVKKVLDYLKKKGVGALSVADIRELFLKGLKTYETEVKRLRKTVEIKIPEFYTVFTTLAEQYREKLGKVLRKLYHELERQIKSIVKPVYQRVLVEYTIY